MSYYQDAGLRLDQDLALITDELADLTARVQKLEENDPLPPPIGEYGHKHIPLEKSAAEPTVVIRANPNDFAIKYGQWSDAPVGAHLILADGQYIDKPTRKLVIGSFSHPKVIRAENPGKVVFSATENTEKRLFVFPPGCKHVEIDGILFKDARVHIAIGSGVDGPYKGTSHHFLISNCQFYNAWRSACYMQANDVTMRNCNVIDSQMVNRDHDTGNWPGALNGVWWRDSENNWHWAKNFSYIDCTLAKCHGEGIHGAWNESFLVEGCTITNCLTGYIQAHDCINATIWNNRLIATKVMAWANRPNSRPRGIVISSENTSTRYENRIPVNWNIHSNRIECGSFLMQTGVIRVDRGQDDDQSTNSYGDIRILDNIITGKLVDYDIWIEKIDSEAPKPSGENILRHSNMENVNLGNPEYWTIR